MAGPPSFRFVHAADLHLDTPFKGLGALAPHVARALREASLDAFDAIVELALAHRASFLLVAGDVYDGAERGLRAQLRFRDGLDRLSRSGIETFVVHGNHDPVGTGWSAVSSWPERVTVFPSSDVLVRTVVRDGEVIATVQGISYGRQAETENLALRLKRPDGPGLHIGLLHCNVAGAADGYANYSPCTLQDLRDTRLDYLALGHVHQRRTLSGGLGEPWVVYPGNSQARSTRSTELEPKGAVLVEVVEGAVTDVVFYPCDRVRFGVVEVPIGGLADLAALSEGLRATGLDQLERAEGRSVLLRARLVGTGPVHGDLTRPGVVEELLETLRGPTLEEDPFCWWDAITDDTTAAVRLEELRVRQDFTGDLARLAEELSGSPAVVRTLCEILGPLPRPLAAALGRLMEDDQNLVSLLERARSVALGELDADRS